MPASSVIVSAALVVLIGSSGSSVAGAPALPALGLTPSPQVVSLSSLQPRAFALTTDRQDFISRRSLAIILAGGTATWLALRGENQ